LSWLLIPPRFIRIPRERAFVETYLGWSTTISQNNAHHIKSAGRRMVAGQASHITSRYRQNVLLLFNVYRGLGWREALRRSCLYFNETKNSVIPRDQVYLSATLPDAHVGCDDPVSMIA
jgi:hypothetical protein